MKKNPLYIVLLLIILITIPILTVIDSNNKPPSPKIKKDNNWEFIISKGITKGYVTLNANFNIFKGPILYELFNASKQDSIAIKEIVQELRNIIPNKTIESYSVFKENEKLDRENNTSNDYLSDHIITFRFNSINVEQGEDVTTIGSNTLGLSTDSRSTRGLLNPKAFFLFDPEISFEKRKQYIQYAFIKKLTKPSYGGDFYNIHTGNDEFENSIFSTKEFQPEGLKFSNYDKFLLQKVYSDNFLEELETYIYKTYEWRYASYLFDKNKAALVGTLITVAMAVIMFVLGFGMFYNKEYKYTYLKYLIPLLVIALSSICLQTLYFYIAHYEVSTSLHDFIGYLIISILVVLILSFLLYVLDRVFIKKHTSFLFKLILKMSFIILLGSISIYLLYLANWPEGIRLSITLYKTYIDYVILLALGRGLLIYLNHLSDSIIKQKDVELSHLKALNSEAEVKLLQSQINPHFLYNALNSIASLAQTDGVKTEKMALSLSDLFKYSINRKGKKNSTIGDEVDMVNNYLEVEQVRFGDRLNFNIEVDENLKTLKIPMFLIQPLIENAVKHGISKVENDGEIVLKIVKNNSNLMISVQDNGPDFPDGLVSGHGLQTVFDLLRLSYNNDASLSWTNAPKKEITITIKNII